MQVREFLKAHAVARFGTLTTRGGGAVFRRHWVWLLPLLSLALAACSNDTDSTLAPTPTATLTLAATATVTQTTTTVPTFTLSPTLAPTETSTPVSTSTHTQEPSPTSTPTFVASASATTANTPTATIAASVTSTAVPTATLTMTPLSAPISSDLAVFTNGGGCYPQPLIGDLPEMLNLVNPHWIPVNFNGTPETDPMLFSGVVTVVHGDTSGDFPSDHTRSDVVADIRLDEDQRFRAASGNPPGVIALEWDGDGYPEFAWPGDGDRIVVLGRWVWDCGHMGEVPGHCSGSTEKACTRDSDCRPPFCETCPSTGTCQDAHFNYQSEIHPPQATAVFRAGRGAVVSADPKAPAVMATRTDIWVSGNGGGAADRCLQTHLPNPINKLSQECYPLAKPLARLNSTDFAFDIPLPPRPAAGQLSYRVVEREAHGGAPAGVEVTPHADAEPPYLSVRVKMTEATANGLPTGYAGTIYAGWVDNAEAFVHMRLTITGMVVHNPLQRRTPASPRTCERSGLPCQTSDDCSAGERCFGVGTVKTWHVQANVNGEWQELVGLDDISAAATISQSLVYDQYLLASGGLRLSSRGAGDDCIGAMFGQSLKRDLAEQGFGNAAQCLLTMGGHDAGIIDVTYPGPEFGSGAGTAEYETNSVGGEGGTCSSSGGLCVLDADCPQGETCAGTGGAYALRYRIARLAN